MMTGLPADIRQRIAQAWTDVGKPEECYATPQQLIAFMRTAPDDAATEVATRMLATIEEAHRRWERDYAEGRAR